MRVLHHQRSCVLHLRRAGPALLALLALLALVWRAPAHGAATANSSVFLPLIREPLSRFPSQDVYPIALRSDLLSDDGFINPDGRYSDEIYKNKTFKRVFEKSAANPNGGFLWLSWRAGPTSVVSFTASLTGTGTLAQGFDEAPWPPSNGLNLPQPPGYPLHPHHLDIGDWVYTYTGVVNASGVRAALDRHIARRTLMILPIYDTDSGNGFNGTLHVVRAGAFLLRGYSLSGVLYLDLVYIG